MRPCLFSTTEPEKKRHRAPQRAFKPQDRPRKSSPNSFHPKVAPGTEAGAARVPPPGPGRLRILTGLSPLCSPSSRSLWQAWRRPHLAVVRSSGPRPEGTFSPPRASVPPPGPPPAAAALGGAGPARRPAPPPRLPRARHPARIQAGPGLPAANLDTSDRPRLVRASGEEPRGRGGKGRAEAKDSLLPHPRGGGREKGNLLN